MNYLNLIMLFFVLGALAIGAASYNNGTDLSFINSAMNNASIVINNLSLVSNYNPTINTSIPNDQGLFLVLEKYIHFVGSLYIEVMRAGIIFGHENPEYFEPEFIVKIFKLIVVILLVSLLIKPIGYLCVFIILFFVWIKDLIVKRRNRR